VLFTVRHTAKQVYWYNTYLQTFRIW